MTKIWNWMTGKKTYLGAALLFAVAVWGAWYGELPSSDSPIWALIGAILTVGLGHKADRLLAALKVAAPLLQSEVSDIKSRNWGAATQDANPLPSAAANVVAAIQANAQGKQ